MATYSPRGIIETWIEKKSALGYTYYLTEVQMPRVNEQFLNCIFFIYPTMGDAQKQTGSPFGGTGFLVTVKSKKHNGIHYTYAITNAHVLEDLRDSGYKTAVLRINVVGGGLDIIEIPLQNWFLHPKGDDVAATPLSINKQWQFKTIPEIPFFLTKRIIEKTGVGTGDDTLTMGRYSMHSGVNTNLITTRFGHISMMPIEPIIQTSRKGNVNYPQDSFLVETYSVNGYSGSPVFVELEPDDREATERVTKKTTYLLGIDWGHFSFNGQVTTNPITGRIDAPSGMMCVVPTWKLKELLYIKELDMHRKQQDEKFEEASKESGISLDSGLIGDEFEKVLKKFHSK